ncbi:MAG: serine hydrolase [Anaerolineae bacterium]
MSFSNPRRDAKQNPPLGGWLLVFVLTALILSGAWFYAGWKSSQRMLPQGLTVGGLDVGGRTQEQALTALAEAYTIPITVYYREESILLMPEMVELTLDVEATRSNLDQILLAQRGIEGFIRYVIDEITGRNVQPQEITPILSYSRERLDAFLNRIAQHYDHPPLEPVALPEAETFRPPQPGTKLDIEASLPPLVSTLLSPVEHEVELVVEVEPIPQASMQFLREALDERLASFTGIAGIFVKNLDTGQELCYNCNVAFAGLSTLKIGIVTSFYRDLDGPPNPEATALISATLTESDNAATNLLLARIGGGDPFTGTHRVTQFLQQIGLKNTFLAVPYNMKEGVPPPDIVTAANARTDLNTNPDPYIQTTPLDIGLLLEALSQCQAGGGQLRLLYPQKITPAECEDTLKWLEQNKINTLLQAGMPEDVRVAHKHGWAGDTHADVALVHSPGARYILSVYLYQPEWLIWEESAPIFADIGRLTYLFFNPNAKITQSVEANTE